MSFSRRAFLKKSIASFMLCGMPALSELASFRSYAADGLPIQPDRRELLLICDTEIFINKRNEGGILVTNPGSLKTLDPLSGASQSIQLPFFGHKPLQNPVRREQILVLEKWGKRSALIDIVKGEILATAQAKETGTFFGHAAFSQDGKTLFTTEDTYAFNEGKLTVRYASDLKIIGEIASYGTRPHECRVIDDGKTLVVANEGLPTKGAASSLSWIDIGSGKLLHKVDFDPVTEVTHGHFDVSHDGWICVLGAAEDKSPTPFFRLLYFISPGGNVFEPDLPASIKSHMRGEALSMAFLGTSGLVAVTLKNTDMLIIMDYKKQKVVDALEVSIPRGVLADAADPENGLLVTSAKNRDLISVSLNANSKLAVRKTISFGGLGSHLTRVYL